MALRNSFSEFMPFSLEVSSEHVEAQLEVLSNTTPSPGRMDFDKQIADAAQGNQAELAQMQWNLQREQISNLSRELSNMRQDISSLRLADSQYEVQNAEMSRHVREMQSQFRVEMQQLADETQETHKRLDVNLSAVVMESQQQITLRLSEQQERIVKDIASVDDRISQSWTASEQRFVSVQKVEQLIQEEKSGWDSLRNFQNRVESEMQSLTSLSGGLESQFNNMQESVRVALIDLSREVGSELQTIREKSAEAFIKSSSLESKLFALDEKTTVSLESLSTDLNDMNTDLTALISLASQKSDAQNEELQQRISEVASQDRAALEELQATLSGELQEHLASLARLRRDLAEHKSSTEQEEVLLRQTIEQERALRERADGASSERMDGFELCMKEQKQQYVELVQDFLSRTKELEDLILSTAAQEAASREELASSLQELIAKSSHKERVAREECMSKIRTELEEAVAKLHRDLDEYRTSSDDVHVKLRALIIAERGAREKMVEAISDQCEDIERRLKEKLERLSQEQSAQYAEVKELISKNSMQDKAAIEELASTTKAEVRLLHNTFEDAELSHRQAREDMERKWNSDFVRMSEDHNLKYEQVKTSFASLQSSLDSLEHKFSGDVKRMQDEHHRAFDELSAKNMEIGDVLSKVSNDLHSKIVEVHSNLLDHVQGVDKRLRELIMQHISEQDAKIAAMPGSCATLERKFRDEFDSLSRDQDGKHSEHKDQLTKLASAHYNEMVDLREEFTRLASQSKVLGDESRNGILSALQELESKLRREFEAIGDQNYDAVYDYLKKERQEREANNSTLEGRLEELDRWAKDGLNKVAQNQDDAFANWGSRLALQERKLREEAENLQERSLGKAAEVQDNLQAVAAEQSAQNLEFKDQIGKLIGEEKRAREDARSTLAFSLEQLDTRLRREIGAGLEKQEVSFQESFLQERHLRENAQTLLTEHLGDFECRQVETLSQIQISMRDSARSDAREIAASACAKEHTYIQTTIAKEQDYRTAQLESINKFLLQEKAAHEAQQESLNVYLTNDKMARELKERNSLFKEDEDAIIKRVQAETSSNLDRDIQVLQKAFEREMQSVQRVLQQAMERDMQSVRQTLLQALNNSVAIESSSRTLSKQVANVAMGNITASKQVSRSASPTPQPKTLSVTTMPKTTLLPVCQSPAVPACQVLQPKTVIVTAGDRSVDGYPDSFVASDDQSPEGLLDTSQTENQAPSNFYRSDQQSKLAAVRTTSPPTGDSLATEPNPPILTIVSMPAWSPQASNRGLASGG